MDYLPRALIFILCFAYVGQTFADGSASFAGTDFTIPGADGTAPVNPAFERAQDRRNKLNEPYIALKLPSKMPLSGAATNFMIMMVIAGVDVYKKEAEISRARGRPFTK